MQPPSDQPQPIATIESGRASIRQAVLTAPLWMPTPNWSSRSIAASVGVSQSFVARIWRLDRFEPGVGAQLRRVLTEQRMTLIGLLVTCEGSCLLLGPEDTDAPQPDMPMPLRSARRLRAVLAADLVRPAQPDADAVGDFWRAVGGLRAANSSLIALTSGHEMAPGSFAGRVMAVEATRWQSLVGPLGQLSEGSARDRLVDLEARLRRWYPERRSPFAWIAGRDRSLTPAVPAAHQRTARERALGDAILEVVRDGLAHGTFGAGEEISERAIAHRLHIGRARVRQALLLLADEGLITATPHGAMAVRLPAVADIVELYVARRALGAIALRAAGRWTAEGRGVAASLLSELQACAERDEVDRAQTLDLAFQNALAQASGLTRIPGMLESLAQQLLMYISVLGVRYSFSPARIAAQDTALFRAIDAKDPDQAVRIWQDKMDEGRQYMLEQTNLLFGHRRP